MRYTPTSGKTLARMAIRPAFYDLSWQPASWDFWMWALNARKFGANCVVFPPDPVFSYADESQESQGAMFGDVVRPIARLLGLIVDCREQTDDDFEIYHWFDPEIGLDQADLPKLAKPPTGPPTVTIRHSYKHPERNSPPLWTEFAAEIGATVIPDAHDYPLSVDDRFEMYASASRNYFWSNGPGAAAIFSDLPSVMVNPVASYGCRYLPVGEQYPFSTKDQVMLWGDPTVKSLVEEHELWTNSH